MKHLKYYGLLICMAVITSGCTVYRTIDLQKILSERLVTRMEGDAEAPNRNKPYYSYYIQPSVGQLESDQTGCLLTYQGNEFLMNLNISAVINDKYYDFKDSDSFGLNDSSMAASVTGTYTDVNNDSHDFIVNIYHADKEESYITVFRSETVEFYSVSDALKAADLAGEMLRIARSVEINQDEIIDHYSNKESISFTGRKIQLFDSIAPESGRVEELFGGNDTAGQSKKQPDEQTHKKIDSDDTSSE